MEDWKEVGLEGRERGSKGMMEGTIEWKGTERKGLGGNGDKVGGKGQAGRGWQGSSPTSLSKETKTEHFPLLRAETHPCGG